MTRIAVQQQLGSSKDIDRSSEPHWTRNGS
jgi:hypothetical protein